MITTLRDLLPSARTQGYAVGAFNITNLETAQAVVEAAVVQQSPVILGVSASALRYGGRGLMAAARALAEAAPVPIVLHLDHQVEAELIRQGLSWGASSVMFDGSLLDLAENIRQTRQFVALARRWRASVEGEIGQIGGQEEGRERAVVLADSVAAQKFARATKVDAVALGLGTSHGLPVPKETIHLDRLDEYYKGCSVPVVLHGASSLPRALIRAGIRHGVTKINVDTQLRQSFTGAVRQSLAGDDAMINPRDYLKPAREAMRKEVARLMKLFGSVNRNHAVRRYR